MATNIFLGLIVFFILSLSTISSLFASNGGFSVKLIHRDSPLSPFYNPSQNPFERVQQSIRRSINRHSYLKNSYSLSSSHENNTIRSTIISNNGEYLMKFGLGKPSHEILAIADTGSDLTWIQCLPCKDCYKQVSPLFDPSLSKTYKDISCSSRQCQELISPGSCEPRASCIYNYGYGDQSYTEGNVALETLTFDSTNGRPIVLPSIIFGCGHNNSGTFNERGSGLVGLGGGPLSLISQLGSIIDGKFSYCLVPVLSESKTKTSTFNFGKQAEISGKGVVSTPLVPKEEETFYHLTLEALSVNGKRVPFLSGGLNRNGSTVKKGNIMIDSGTTLTVIPPYFYEKFESEVKKAIDIEPVPPPEGISLCYNVKELTKVPKIVAHFTNADIALKPLNTFVEVVDGKSCLVFVPSEDFSIFGNLAQMDFLIEYDLKKKRVSFKQTDCTKY